MAHIHCSKCSLTRREALRTGLFGMGIGRALPAVFGTASLSIAAQAFQTGQEKHPERIMVVVELTGGNDGLDTIIPWSNDQYQKLRPTLNESKQVLKANDDLGFHHKLSGLYSMWNDGSVAVVNGCGYPNPDRSHFSSMEYWHTASPHAAQNVGWVGRVADTFWKQAQPNEIINIAQKQSLAVQSQRHSPVVFNNPDAFVRAGDALQGDAYHKLVTQSETGNATLDFVSSISRTAEDSSVRVREAVKKYQTPVAYGAAPLSLDLRKVAALISAGFPTRVYYVSLSGFDTHASQLGGRQYLLTGLGEGLNAFMSDVKRMGRANDVALMMFSEFGRRVEENASGGTDHGTAGPMFVMGKSIKPGFYGKHPSLTDLDENGDLKMTTDFRRVYATMIKGWMGYDDTHAILNGDYAPLPIFG